MTATVESSDEHIQESGKNISSVDALADEFKETEIQSDAEDTQAVAEPEIPDSRPRIVYTRKQLVRLSQSPLIKVPDGMPSFKSWFGDWSEQSLPSTKKESETLNSNGATRERRYRREAEDGDGAARPPFRSALSQPSQMGNFKHQPLRSSDRDRDRDTERDLRSLSDRYDRDKATRGERIGLPSHSTLLRNRDRDSAPHLVSDRDAQRPLARKRNGESKEDWRRGAEPPRAGRDETHSRRDRDDRERQRSRARDSSRQRDSPPSTRRDRDDHRRDRDRDRFNDADDDTRRWRDDGKRDDRLNSRRDKDRPDQKSGRDRSREREDERDGWTIADDKKRSGRDRRYDDGRDKEDRKEREKEKEPAWMETYVPPSSSSAGILGGKGDEGEVDSIQAWKKDMKEREMKAKGLTVDSNASTDSAPLESAFAEDKPTKSAALAPEGQLDEIQLFKLMMKQEEKKRTTSGDGKSSVDDTGLQPTENGTPGLMRIRSNGANRNGSPVTALPETGMASSIDPLLASKPNMSLKASISGMSLTPSPSTLSGLGAPPNLTNSGLSPTVTRTESNGPRLFSLRTADSGTFNADPQSANKDSPSTTGTFDPPRQSRLLAFGATNTKVTAQPSPQSAVAAVQMGRLQQVDPLWPNQRRPSVSPAIPLSTSQQLGLDKANLQQQLLASGQFDVNITDNGPRRSGHDSVGHNPLFYENGPRSGHPMDMNRDYIPSDIARALTNASERGAFLSHPDSLHHMVDARRNPTPPSANYGGITSPISPYENQLGSQTTYSSGKGSRMAKHFERQRDQTMNVGRSGPNSGMGSNGIMPNRQEQQSLNNALAGGDNRNFEQVMAMLNNSSQTQRSQQVHGLNQNLGHHQPQSLHMGPSTNSIGRHESLLDVDEGRFAPDGLVPGLRPAPAPSSRNREMSNGSLYANQLDESLAFNGRLGPQQRGTMDQLFPGGPMPGQFNGQGPSGSRGGLNFQQQQAMRTGPSPINNFNPMQGPPQQRLPPGLANLGGRPPHEPSQLLGGGAGNFGGLPSQLHGGLHGNNPQSFNQFQNPNLGMLGNQGHLRGQPGLGQLGNALGNGLNGMDFRGGPGGPPQNQMLGLGGPNLGQGMRGGPGFNAQQPHGLNQLPPAMNPRQQHNLQPQMLQQLVPQQLQGIPGHHNPNELMALLMGGPHRE